MFDEKAMEYIAARKEAQQAEHETWVNAHRDCKDVDLFEIHRYALIAGQVAEEAWERL